MRSRENIEEQFKEITVQTGQEQVTKLLFELLLDIRDTLTYMKNDTLLDRVMEARKEQEDTRRNQIKENLSD